MTDWDERSERFDKTEWANRAEWKDILNQIPFTPGDIVLDLGCGNGFIGSFYNAQVGLDISLKMAKNCPFMVVKGDARNIPFDNEYFDSIVSRMLFHHISYIEDVVNECFRVLKYGGQMLMIEGTPPWGAEDWFSKMFVIKEQRTTYSIIDCLKIFLPKFRNHCSLQTFSLPSCSVRHWLTTSGVTQEQFDKIWQMHLDMPQNIKDAYGYLEIDNDILLDFQYTCVVAGK